MEIIEGFRVGRWMALQKPDGGVRGIVVGDTVRQLVARTMAKQVAKQAEKATAPFQYALSTKAGAILAQAVKRSQAFAFCVVVDLVVHLSATTSVRSDAAPWMVSSRQCRTGPDLERSTPTSIDVAEEDKTTFRASAGPLEEDTRRSVTRQGAQSRGSDGCFGTRRLCHESRARGGSEACEGVSQSSGQDGSRHQDGRSPRAGFQVGEGFDRFGRISMASRSRVCEWLSNEPRRRHRKCLSQSKSERGRLSSNGQGNGSPESTKRGRPKFAVWRKPSTS